MGRGDRSEADSNKAKEAHLTQQEIDNFNEVMKRVVRKGDRKAASLWISTTVGLKQYRLIGRYDAAFILNEAYMRGVNAINNGQEIKNHLAWLRQTSRNVIKELSRKRNREDASGIDMDTFAEDNSEEASWGETPSRMAEYERMHHAFDMLSPMEQQILSMKVVKDLKWQEIADIFTAEGHRRMTVEGLRQRKSRALKKLRNHFQQSL